MRKLFNWIFDWVTGFGLNKRLRELQNMDHWSREEIDVYQQKMFEKLKIHATRSEIYAGCTNWNLVDFPKYPKEYYRNNQEKFLTNFRKPYRIESTSGSTGTPRNVIVSKEMILAKRASHLKMLNWYGVKREELEVFIGGLSKNWKFKLYYLLKNKIFLSSYNITSEKAVEYIRKINRIKPAIIFTYPYSIDLILSTAEKKGLTLHQPRVIYTGAENLYPHIEQRIRKHFPNSNLVNEYWSTEANLGVTCPLGSMHVDEDTVIVEVDNKDADGVGDLLLTNLFSYDMPLIRYRLGDRIKLSEQKCSCGRNTKVIEKIHGRDIDFFVLPDGRKIAYTENSIQIAQMSSNITTYQVQYNSNDNRITFCYIRKDQSMPIEEARIGEYFQKNYHLPLIFREVDFIASEKSGKFSIFKTV